MEIGKSAIVVRKTGTQVIWIWRKSFMEDMVDLIAGEQRREVLPESDKYRFNICHETPLSELLAAIEKAFGPIKAHFDLTSSLSRYNLTFTDARPYALIQSGEAYKRLTETQTLL